MFWGCAGQPGEDGVHAVRLLGHGARVQKLRPQEGEEGEQDPDQREEEDGGAEEDRGGEKSAHRQHGQEQEGAQASRPVYACQGR